MAAAKHTKPTATDAIVVQIDEAPSAPIYKVPAGLRELKQSAYTPRLVSIGPLHSRDKRLRKSRVNKAKQNCLKSLIRRARADKSKVDEATLENAEKELQEEIEKSVEEAKKYYEEDADKALVNANMLLADACFVLELLYRHYDDGKVNLIPELGITSVRTYRTVQRDLLLLENQLPFFVIETVFDFMKTKADAPEGLFLVECVLSFFSDLLNTQPGGDRKEIKGSPYHILHLLHVQYRPARLPNAACRCQFMQSASDLDYAGVKFESHNAKSPFESHNAKSPFQVEFEAPSGLKRWWFCSAYFKIPTLHIDDSTELFLRNLVAFEQCCPCIESYVTSYAFVMDRLINTAKDVDVLQKAGILCNYLGSHKEASDLFNKLCSDVAIGDFYFAKTCKDAHEYSRQNWPKAVAALKRNNFATPWGYIAFCVAFVLFFSSVVTIIRNLRELSK